MAYNGKIATQNEQRSIVGAIAIRDGMTSAVWLLMIFTRPLEVLLCGPDDDLVDVHLGWLLDGVSDRTSD